eukprot:CAMPEP_0115007928 /NCGR_PEP_ID=MMETSP0216-20121206/21560_1 /TAXON_ID=223996 /ORGANISM="Protocruzia adherens, Strain Boccale" /LENGTH=78 /DNA_ID=CAMNT_0002375141 /DNA_START=43 /DNA_END=276 /DNA_ORIENTATION=+
MSKKPVSKSGRGDLSTTIQQESWRQRLKTEERILASKTSGDIARLEHLLNEKNSYLNLYQSEEGKKKQEEDFKPQFTL